MRSPSLWHGGFVAVPWKVRDMADVSAERGRGIALMRALADTVSFESRPQAGTVVHLVKRLDLDQSSPLRRLAPRRED